MGTNHSIVLLCFGPNCKFPLKSVGSSLLLLLLLLFSKLLSSRINKLSLMLWFFLGEHCRRRISITYNRSRHRTLPPLMSENGSGLFFWTNPKYLQLKIGSKGEWWLLSMLQGNERIKILATQHKCI